MVTSYMFQKVRELRTQGLKKSQIAKRLGIDRKTVSKYLASNAPPKYSPRKRGSRQDLFSGFDKRVRSLLEITPDLTARETFEFIWDEGYRGSERTVNRRVSGIRGEKPKERFFEQEYEPGEQAQFDFKESVVLPFIDGEREVQLHFGTLPYSDVCVVRGYPGLTYECFMDGVHHFFERVGGMPKNVRIDNLSPCVSKVLKGSERLWTAAFSRAIAYYGFGVLPCAPGRGNEKGDVERDIRTFARRIQNFTRNRGMIFEGWDHLNQWLLEYMASRRTEESSKRFEVEEKKLLPAPPRDEGVLCRVEMTSGSSHGTVRIGKSTYSIPDKAIGIGCRVVSGPYDVRVFQTYGARECLAVHPRVPDGKHSLLLNHVLPSLVRKPQAMVRWAHREILFPTEVFKKFYRRLKTINSSGAEREYLRSINLVQYTPLSEIAAGMELVLETKSEQLFEELRELLLSERRPADVIEMTHHFAQSPINPKLSDYDSFIPRGESK